MRKILVFAAVTLLSTFAGAYSYGQWGSKWEQGSVSGYEPGRNLYVCRVHTRGGVHPGKEVSGYCNIGYGGQEEVYADYEVYTGAGQWYDKDANFWWGGVVVGGYESGRDLIVCLAPAHGGWHPGKVVNGHCNIGYGGREEVYSNYSILVE